MLHVLQLATHMLPPLILIAAGLIAGLIFERVILKRLVRFAAKTSWRGDEVISKALRGVATFWFVIAGIAAAVHRAPLDPAAVSDIQTALLVMVILSVTAALARLAAGFIALYAEQADHILPSTSLFTNLTKLIIYSLGVLIILSTLGISIAPILTALGIGGLAVALALQGPLSNLFAGLQIVISRPIKPGDYIRLDSGEEGYIIDISWRSTMIRELANNMIIVPNAKLASAVIKNYYLPEQPLAVLVEVGVSYDSDLEKVERVTTEVAKTVLQEVQGGDPEFDPFIRYHTFDDFSINFTVILRGEQFVDQFLLKHEFIKRLHRRYDEEGIEIPFPIRTVQLRQAMVNPIE
ncbi:MAG: mechanosensitive ion channel protein [Herpetosiphonaceae bacterium]|nr:MAG: mechanosensitive ion channel protein [Herpetosiphonaceae bacterium]